VTHARRTTFFTGTLLDPDGEHGRRPAAGSRVEASYRCSGGRVWLAVPIGAALAGFLAAFLRHRRA
jgi:hypothetical protein